MKINIGCGMYRPPGWINVDVQEIAAPDVVASAEDLPFTDSSATHVYAGHVLEHMDLDGQLHAALVEIRRVLRPDGELMVVGPDLDRAKALWPEMVDAIWPGAQHEAPGAKHLWPSTVETTVDAIVNAGYYATEVPIRAVPEPWPVTAYIGWQLAIYATPT